MPEKSHNANVDVSVDGFIQTLVSMGGQMECIASEEKHPKPELVEEDELKRAIQEMLVENTGCSILDSGGIYGRGWEKNRGRDFENEAAVAIEVWDDQVSIQYNVYTYLTNFLEITEGSKELDKPLQRSIELHDNDSYMEDMEDFMKELEQEEEMKIVRDAKSNKVYHKNCGGEISYGVLEQW